MRRAARPNTEGQRLEVEDRDGDRWDVHCQGDPVSIGDRVTFEIVGKPEARKGELTRLESSERSDWVCRVVERPGHFDLVPFGGEPMPPFVIGARLRKGAVDGDRVVVVAATDKPDKSSRRRPSGPRSGKGPPGKVVAVLGPAGSPEADFRAIAWKHRLSRNHPRRARIEADASPEEIPAAEIARRLDLRALPFMTIDPATARDHDDAVFAEARSEAKLGVVTDDGQIRKSSRTPAWTHRLWVAIADVAHYVERGSSIDAEARRRGNSTYLTDRAIPMLPERLSTNLCSLVPDVDRLSMVAELRILPDGRVGDALFHEAVIRSHAKLSYEEAASWLGDESGADRPVWFDSLRLLDEIAGKLLKNRRESGAVMLELPEVGIEIDGEGRPVGAKVRERNAAHFLIEEAMLAANRAVAGAVDAAAEITLHRVHPPPQPAKLEALTRAFETWMPETHIDLEDPKGLARALDAARGQSFEERAHTSALRSMSQARYEAVSGGHYALRFEHYLHFTSPIRRYADLDVHRALKGMIRRSGRDPENAPPKRDDEEDTRRLAAWLSGRERMAMEAEREAISLASTSLMADRVGEVFEAQVASASEFGLFIRLDDPAVGGLVPVRTMKGYWTFDQELDALVGPQSGAQVGFGDRLTVRLTEADLDRSRLTFESVRRDSQRPRSRRRGS